MTFTQFLRPDGRQKTVEIERPAEIETLAKKVLAKGLRFEIEELQTGDVSMTVSDGDEDLFIRICPNGPDVPLNVDLLVREAAGK